ncbi:MAG: hypothetical protein ACM3N4_01460 [Nitrososphaerota archaeon]
MGRLKIHWGEASGAWANDCPDPMLVPLLEANPFGSFTELSLNRGDTWQPYQRDVLVEALSHTRDVWAQTRSADGQVEAWLTRDRIQNNFNLFVHDEARIRGVDPEAILRLMHQFAIQLPWFLDASADAMSNLRDFWDAHHLPNLADTFGYLLKWAHVVAPRSYGEYYTPQVLLQAPAYRVRELEDQRIELVTYAHPLDFDTAEAQARIIDVATYLASQFRQQTLVSYS